VKFTDQNRKING